LIGTSYDPEADALFVWFAPEGTKSADTEEVGPGILLAFDTSGRANRHRGAWRERALSLLHKYATCKSRRITAMPPGRGAGQLPRLPN
jgi:Protein of unknown function (DUF2283)